MALKRDSVVRGLKGNKYLLYNISVREDVFDPEFPGSVRAYNAPRGA